MAKRLPVPVISVGNLTIGGTGKTPVVMTIASRLKNRGLRVAVISRGYGRKGEETVLCVSSGDGPQLGVEEAGDEPYLLAKKLRGIGVWVGRERFQVAIAALTRDRHDVIVLDDGFQHRTLFRDLDIVVARTSTPWNRVDLIPKGSMREPIGSLKRAHVLVLNWRERPSDRLLWRCFYPHLVFLKGRLKPKGIKRVLDDDPVDLEEVRGCNIAAFCGVGEPRSFKETLEEMGLKVKRFLPFPDHHWYTPKDLGLIREAARAVDYVVTTEKDGCKLRDADLDPKKLLAVEVEMELSPIHVMDRILDEYCHGGDRVTV